MGMGGKRDGGYPYGSPLVFFKITEFIIFAGTSCMHTYINNMTNVSILASSMQYACTLVSASTHVCAFVDSMHSTLVE